MEKKGLILFAGDKYISSTADIVIRRMREKFTAEEGYELEYEKWPHPLSSWKEAALQSALFAKKPAALVLSVGTEEYLGGKKWDDIRSEIDELTGRAAEAGTRLVILTAFPVGAGKRKLSAYGKRLLEYAREIQVRAADVYGYCLQRGLTLEEGSPDSELVFEAAADAVMPVLIRTKMLVLWQFNGRYAHCNYACPYCYVATSVNKGIHFNYDMKRWEDAFSRHFEGKDVVFYFSYGEPMMAGRIFYEALEMIGRHPAWQVRMTSNVSLPLDRLLESTVARTGRLNVNASFHPTQIGIEEFLKQCDTLREHGIEPSVIYVMYPEQIDALEEYMKRFREKGYRVHIRAFRGLYHGKKYPQAYTKEQWEKTARYMDRGNFKYQLHAVNGLGRMSMLGMTHILVDNYGKIEMCDSYVGDRRYGNIFDEKIYLDVRPHPFPGLVPLAAVDDIADYTELGYSDLEDNNVNSYNTQGGVIKKENGEIVYPYEFVDFSDEALVKKLKAVPKPFMGKCRFWFSPRWFCRHFIYSYLIKKYGKYIWAWIKGKWRLLRSGNLKLKNFWHS